MHFHSENNWIQNPRSKYRKNNLIIRTPPLSLTAAITTKSIKQNQTTEIILIQTIQKILQNKAYYKLNSRIFATTINPIQNDIESINHRITKKNKNNTKGKNIETRKKIPIPLHNHQWQSNVITFTCYMHEINKKKSKSDSNAEITESRVNNRYDRKMTENRPPLTNITITTNNNNKLIDPTNNPNEILKETRKT